MSTIGKKTSFAEATQEALSYLHDRLGLQTWLIARVLEDDWYILSAHNETPLLQTGAVLSWQDTLCFQMVAEETTRAITNLAQVPNFLNAPLAEITETRAYVGVPIYYSEGELFGTLCGFDPSPQSDVIVKELPQVEIMARLLESVLENELKEDREVRRNERETARVLSDPLTGLYTYPCWETLVESEEKRCQRLGHPAAIISIQLEPSKQDSESASNENAEETIVRMSRLLRKSVRKTDIIARVADTEFLILAVECKKQGAELIRARLERALDYSKIPATIGVGFRTPHSTLPEAQLKAISVRNRDFVGAGTLFS